MRTTGANGAASWPGCSDRSTRWASTFWTRPLRSWAPPAWRRRWAWYMICSASSGGGSGSPCWAPRWISSSGLWSPRGSFSMPSPPGAGSCAFIWCWPSSWGRSSIFWRCAVRPSFWPVWWPTGSLFSGSSAHFPWSCWGMSVKKLKKLQRSTSIMAEDGIILD